MKYRFPHNVATGAAAFAALAVAAIAVSTDAHALEYSYRFASPHVAVVDASGEFMPNEDRLFNAWLNHLPFPLYMPEDPMRAHGVKLGAVIFNSPGGNVYGAMEWAAYAQQHGINTGIMAGGRCVSACVFAWAAGPFKSAAPDASIGVHRPSLNGSNASMGPDSTPVSDEAIAPLARFLASRGAPQSVIGALYDVSPSDVHWLTADELAEWRVKVAY
jgi:hypothetical protein